MFDYCVKLICIGFDDELFDLPIMKDMYLTKKGTIWRVRTGKKHEDNGASLSLPVTLHEGYGVALDHLKARIESEPSLSVLLQNSREVEVRFSASWDDEQSIPSFHLTVPQIEFLLKINAELDIHIS